MYNSKILTNIETYKNSLTKSETKIVKFLEEKITDVIYMSVTEFADTVDVGETTILRFCRKIGFKGYQDFKIAVAQDDINKNNIETKDSISEKIYDSIVEVLSNSKNLIKQEDIDEVIDIMNKARKVYFFGVGSSGITALEAKSKFFRIHRKFDAVTDSHFQSMVSEIVNEDDVIVVLTLSGSTKDVVDVVERAKQNGAKIVTITNYQRAPITKHTDILLLTSNKKMQIEGGAMVEKITQLYMIDILYISYVELKDEFKDRRRMTARSVVDKKY
ncbi:MurR/RpiR family transcriptional regulator [Haloplasma contractile]|uniref:Asparaginyl-tRNA synthetase protein n=1 Tax=Haloplasma contractile SSD-17B TaxID=1033810 RepID=F7PRC4_9MOLU|nr:MurR/RpiR family transcriptional regulator [Haloplasma contractile]ERJ11750.1 asparaginyl-tRNA synthetase protein [Haloplasma contractile SSD-17B]